MLYAFCRPQRGSDSTIFIDFILDMEILLPSSSVLRNEWKYTAILPYVFTEFTQINTNIILMYVACILLHFIAFVKQVQLFKRFNFINFVTSAHILRDSLRVFK
jgi:hypothetical protein